MAVVLGTSSGFVTVAPSADPAGTGTTIDGSSVVTKHTAPAGAIKITSIGWYRESGTNTANWEIALYANTGGVAAARLFVDNTNSTASNGWLTTAVDWAVTGGTDYWFALQMDAHTGSSGVDRADTGGVGSDILTSQTTLADPYGGGAVADADGMYAIYGLVKISHAASGALTGPGAVIAGTASSATTRAATGALTGTGKVIAGTAARTRVHATTGVLAGAGSVIAGEALREDHGATEHAATGVLAGPGAAIVGAASSATTRTATGAIVGAGSAIAGTASSKTTRAATGTIAGAGALLSGSSARVGAPATHASSGILSGPGALIVGIAAKPADTSGAGFDKPRDRIPAHHGASGRLQGKGATIRGNARLTRTGQNPLALLLTAA